MTWLKTDTETIIAKLSPEEQNKARRNMMIYGEVFITEAGRVLDSSEIIRGGKS